jgi:hypothetical protein
VICPKCFNRTNRKALIERGCCSRCFHLGELEPFHRATVADFLRERIHLRWEGASSKLSAVKETFRPPPGFDEWKLWHIVDIDSDRLNWG